MRDMNHFSIWLLFIIILTGCATAPKRPEIVLRGDYGAVREYISRLVRYEMQQQEVPGLSIALVDDQQLVWSDGFGYADQANLIAASAGTIYRVGSISKLFTATAAMQLAEQGSFAIDAPLTRYLPEFTMKSRFPATPPITARSIMTHHAGVPSDLAKGMWTARPEPLASILPMLRDDYLVLPPNTVYAYSNLGFSLLGLAMEKSAGTSFAVLLERSLLRPLGMDQSSFSQLPPLPPQGSKSYSNSKEMADVPLRDLPAGGLNSTAVDLARFMQMLFADGKAANGELLVSPATLAEMFRPQNSDVPLDLNFRVGLGWALSGLGDIDIRNAGPVAHHSGATLYHRSMLITLPEQRLGVVVLANSSNSGSVVNKVASETLKLALLAKTGRSQPKRQQPAAAGVLPQDELNRYGGNYATMMGVVKLTPGSGHLLAELQGRSIRLTPRADGQLRMEYRLFGLFPISLGELDHIGISRTTIAGEDILKATLDGQEILVGKRLQPKTVPWRWLTRIGSYEAVNAGDDAILFDQVELRCDNDMLVIDYAMPLFFNGKLGLAIEPLSDTEAVIAGLGRMMGETIQMVRQDDTELFRFAGYLFRKKIP